ncbi:4-hydroxyphenylpyruvate dioxygenase [Kaistia soli DSM 19436]|uniref:3-dehydroshikimate dehydratase n=1 Tax=Kaistia soli DSM 19436 TaxID=1122133 RepID=A0A1M4U6V3_9HYPH|nr:sugar phosphate isomerase/epimerase and 4-hydroxyphenylpyruvate domain-containing protein [Kaistia soli]SHE52307.1 4-hydroxyphenylpyruvate dioxygenase [Kaistia soli DSM 19436]
MKTSIATVSLSGDLAEKLRAIAAAGFDGVEIFEADFLAFDETPRAVGAMVRDAGLEITLFQPFRDFEGLPEPQRQLAFDRAERKFDVMGELGTELMLVCSNVSPLSLGGIDRAAADFRELGERAARRGIRVGYEALAWGRHIHDHRDAWEIVRRADHPNIGLILDSFHTLARKIDVASIRSIPADKIFIVQLADAPMVEMDLLYWSRHFRNMPGEGGLPVVDFMRAVAATGYAGPLSLEIFNDQFRGASPRSIAVDGHRSLINLMDQVSRDEPGNRIAVPVMPPRVEVKGVEFVEFATNDTEAAALGGIFALLGFEEAAQHRSKKVTLYRQGEINLLINTEPRGLAHSSFVTHGASAYAICLRVENAADTVKRSEALDAEIYEQPVASGELVIPAIRGLGGSLLYFIDETSELGTLWQTDFLPVSTSDAPPSRLTRIDHIAQTMNYEDMLSWLLFYGSIFKTSKTPMLDVVDPSGLVRSQVIENDSGSFRLTLNGAENHRTLAGYFIAETFGAGVQHIAFAADDIFAAADAVAAGGLDALAISANYYDDLAARFGFDPARIEAMRARNILYDRDEGGEFFQFYTPVLGSGFFLEIVERRGDYAGYGASNAPFRIAAQKRGLRPPTIPRL